MPSTNGGPPLSRSAFVRAVYSEARKKQESARTSTTGITKRRTINSVRHGVGKVIRQNKMVEMWEEPNDSEEADQSPSNQTGHEMSPSSPHSPKHATMEQFTDELRGVMTSLETHVENVNQAANDSLAPVTVKIIEEMIIEFEVPELQANEIRANVDAVILAIRESWEMYSKAYQRTQKHDPGVLAQLFSLTYIDVLGPQHKNVLVTNDLTSKTSGGQSQGHAYDLGKLCSIAKCVQRKLKAKFQRNSFKTNAWPEKTETRDVEDYLDAAYDPGPMSRVEAHTKAISLGSKEEPKYKKVNNAARMQLIFDKPQRLLAAIPRLQHVFKKISCIKNNFPKPACLGWRDLTIYVEVQGDLGERFGAELQLTLRTFFDAQVQLESHLQHLSSFLPDPDMQKFLFMKLTGVVHSDLDEAREKHEARMAALSQMRQELGAEITDLLGEAQRWAQIHADMQATMSKLQAPPDSPRKKNSPDQATSPSCDPDAERIPTPESPTWPPPGAPAWGSQPQSPSSPKESNKESPKNRKKSNQESFGEPLADHLAAQQLAQQLPDLQQQVLELCGPPAESTTPKTPQLVSRAGALAMLKAQGMTSGDLLGKLQWSLEKLASKTHQQDALVHDEIAYYRQKREEVWEAFQEGRNAGNPSCDRAVLENSIFETTLDSKSGTVDTIREGLQYNSDHRGNHVNWESQEVSTSPSQRARIKFQNKLDGLGDFEEWPPQTMPDEYLTFFQLSRGLVQVEVAKLKPKMREEFSRGLNASHREYSVQESTRGDNSIHDSESCAPIVEEEEEPSGFGFSGAPVLRVGSPLRMLAKKKPSPLIVSQTQVHRSILQFSNHHLRSSTPRSRRSPRSMPTSPSLSGRRHTRANLMTSEVALTASNLQTTFGLAAGLGSKSPRTRPRCSAFYHHSAL